MGSRKEENRRKSPTGSRTLLGSSRTRIMTGFLGGKSRTRHPGDRKEKEKEKVAIKVAKDRWNTVTTAGATDTRDGVVGT